MLVKTKWFGEIDLTEDKIVEFEQGVMGFEKYQKYTILYDVEKEERSNISWLQSVDEPSLAFPVINPFAVKKDYNPIVEDEWLSSLGELNEDNLVILLMLTVPEDMKKVTANLKAPLVINAETRRGCQIICQNEDYPVKFNVFEAVQAMKKEKGVD